MQGGVRMRGLLQATTGAGRGPQRRSGSAGGCSAAVVSVVPVLGGCSCTGEREGAASSRHLRLMTAEQYTNSLGTVFGEDIADSVPAPLPPTPRTDGLLASGAAGVGVNSDQLGQLQQAAVAVAAQVADGEHRDSRASCAPGSDRQRDDACARAFLEQTGRLLYRRPLGQDLLTQLSANAGEAGDELEDFFAGLGSVLEGMLVSY